MNKSIEQIRENENNAIAKHLYAIEAIAKQKSIGSGIDKTIGKLILHGIGQFHLSDALREIEELGYKKVEQSFSPKKINRTKDIIHKENKDIVRHLINIRNIVNTKCNRCPRVQLCMDCGFSGREDFNIESGMRIIFLYDWKAIYEVLKLQENSYWDEVYEFINGLHNKLGGGKMIEMKDPDFETNYI